MQDYRREFFDFAPTLYLNCAYHGPFPRATAERIQRAIEMKCNPARIEPPHFFGLTERVRERLARLVGAHPSEIALTNSATQGIGAVAAGLEWASGDEVVVASVNFPSNLFTWLNLRRRGVSVRVLKPADSELKTEEVAAALTPRTRVLALDWVSYTTGMRLDLAELGELAHRQGAWFVVDGTQGVGALALDVHALLVDALAVAAYKWLLGPYGTGFVYFSSGLRERLELQAVNWLSVEGSDQFDSLPVDHFTLPRAAKVFDVPATASFLNLHGLEASLEFVERVGVGAVTAHCRHLLDRLADELRRRNYLLSAAAQPEHQSTILCFQAGSLEATAQLHAKLVARHIAVSLRHEWIRVSPYLYNDDEDLDRLLAAVDGRT